MLPRLLLLQTRLLGIPSVSLQDHEPDLPRIFSKTGNCCRRQYTSLPVLQKQQNLFSEECLLLSSPAGFACVCVRPACPIPWQHLLLSDVFNFCQSGGESGISKGS